MLIKAEEPLPFTPYTGPISLDTPGQVDVHGPINLFDPEPLRHQEPPENFSSSPQRVNTPQSTDEEQIAGGIAGGIAAPRVDDTKELDFDWPSEEIKSACENLFPGNKEWILPALNWIAPDNRVDEEGEMMQDIQ